MAMAKIPSTMLDRSGKGDHPCLGPTIRRKTFRLSPLNMILSVVVSYIPFI